MKYSKYPLKINNDHTHYEFISEGQRGPILKAVIYAPIEDNLFNLAFGDWNPLLKKMDDITISNNGDRDKVLVTVASTAIDFTNQFPEVLIYVEGSTPARTRLYQMAIAKNIEELNETFEIEGYINESWEPFRKGRNYDAFLAQRK